MSPVRNRAGCGSLTSSLNYHAHVQCRCHRGVAAGGRGERWAAWPNARARPGRGNPPAGCMRGQGENKERALRDWRIDGPMHLAMAPNLVAREVRAPALQGPREAWGHDRPSPSPVLSPPQGDEMRAGTRSRRCVPRGGRAGDRPDPSHHENGGRRLATQRRGALGRPGRSSRLRAIEMGSVRLHRHNSKRTASHFTRLENADQSICG